MTGQDVPFQIAPLRQRDPVFGGDIATDLPQVRDIPCLDITLHPAHFADNQVIRGQNLSLDLSVEVDRAIDREGPLQFDAVLKIRIHIGSVKIRQSEIYRQNYYNAN